ncbi:M48 family metalloprotease [Halomonas sp. Bachu 37]|uniref:M48 family metalloprotease n=1 Tax=Halomonas kashgarensis TaxID=3084920 RepID=UPI003217E0B8
MLRLYAARFRLGFIALALWLFSTGLAAFDESGLPSLSTSATQAAGDEEHRLGRAWLRQFRAQAPEWQDPITQAYIETLIARLLPHSSLGDIRTSVVLVDSPSLNAFAVPGGIIGVNAGLFAFADEEGAFVSVLAHELGHLSQRHYARGTARAEQTQFPAMAAMLAGMVIAASGGGQAGLAAAVSSQAALIQDQLTYSRRFEQEADRVGLQAMASAGFDPESMVQMFRAMQRMASLQGGTPPEFLLTHPVSESRLSDAQARASQLSHSATQDNEPHYSLLRARALYHIHQSNPQQAASRLAENGDDNGFAKRYLEALTQAGAGRTDSALQQLDRLARELPDLTMLPASAAEVALKARRYDEAIERSRRLLRWVPDYLPAQMFLAEALLQNDPNEAYRVLRDITQRYPENPQAFSFRAEAAGRSGKEAWGHIARAEYLQLTGRIDRGIHQLAIAKDVAQQQNDQQALGRIEQRREDFITYRETMEKFE